MKKWKKILSVLLAASMVTGLGACGQKGNGDPGKSNANAALAKQYVYRMEAFDFSGIQKKGDDTYVQRVSSDGERVYLISQSYDYSGNSSESGPIYRLLSMKMDGTDARVCEIQTVLKDGASDAAGGGSESAGNEPGEGTTAESTAAEDGASVGAEEGAADAVAEEEPDYGSSVYENISLGNFLIDKNMIWGTKNHYFEDYSDPENYVSKNDNYICAWDMDGNMLWETQIQIGDENEWYNISNMAVKGNGKAVALITGNVTGFIDIDEEGTVSELKSADALEEILENLAGIAVAADGRWMISYYEDNWTDMYVVYYDVNRGQLGERYPLPASVANSIGGIVLDKDGDLVYSTNIGVFQYHLGDEDSTQIMSFVNSDFESSYLSAVCPVDDDHFIGIYSEYDEENYNSVVSGGIFTRVPPEEIPDKTVLVLGGIYVPSDLKKRVIDFNKTSTTHRIVLKDYSTYNTYDDYNAGSTQLNNDIIAGNMPDILVLDSSSMKLDSYISKGLLADIGELISKDEELSGKEFIDNVFEACRVNGKLYEIIPSFSVYTFVGKKSLVGEPEEWTMDEAEAYLEKMPEGATLFSEMTRSSFLQTAMQICGSDFIDVSTGKCNFNSPEFIALMEFAKELPAELGEDYYTDDWYMLYESQYRENRTLLSNCSIYDIANMVYMINGNFGEEVSFVGFPGGNGAVINTDISYALSSKSADLDAAWDFMRYYLTDEYQEALEWAIPVNKNCFEAKAQKATKRPTYTDENGKEVESEYNWWINDEMITLDPLTEQQVQEIKDYIYSVDKRSYYNVDVSNIISEEMEAFYQGQKSAEEVAGIIQSRAQLFVNENR